MVALAALGVRPKQSIATASEGQEPDGFAEAFRRAEEEIGSLRARGIEVVGFFDELYPDRLRGISSPPAFLYVRGDTRVLSARRLAAVVGTRRPSRFGSSAAEAATAVLAEAGVGIVSGLARGVDTIAHRVALEHGVPTVATLGCGLDRIYPKENRELADEIVAAGGLLVSEWPLADDVRVPRLIARSRLQTGLSVMVVAVETGADGGTMHTAKFAVEQQRALWCPMPHGTPSSGVALLLGADRDALKATAAFRSPKKLVEEAVLPVAHAFTRDELPDLVAETLRRSDD